MTGKKQIEIYTKDWCPYCRRAKSLLRSLGLDFQEYEVSKDEEKYREMVDRSGEKSVPQIFLGDQNIHGYSGLIEKITTGELDKILEIERPDLQENIWELAIIGAGPAGMTAAVYAARKGLKVILITRDIGGQVLETDQLDNYMARYGTTGPDLMQEFLNHVQKYEVDTLFGEEVTEVDHDDDTHTIITKSDKRLKTKSVIVAVGSRKRRLRVEGESELKDKGVSYCATCDGFHYEGEPVVVVGGGNSGLEAALDMAKLGSKVTLLEGSENISGDQYLQHKVIENSRIEILSSQELIRIKGEEKVTGVLTRNVNTGKVRDISVSAVFIEIGLIPNTGFICDEVEVNDHDEIVINDKNETSIKGIYAAGDVTNIKDKQVIISAAEGAKAALRVSQYLS